MNSNFIGITTLHVSGSLSAHHQEFLAVHWHWYISCSSDDCCYQFDDRLLPRAGWDLIQFHPAPGNSHQPGSKSHENCIKCTKADVWLRAPDYGWKGCLKHVVVIPIKLEFSASVGFIHKDLSHIMSQCKSNVTTAYNVHYCIENLCPY